MKRTSKTTTKTTTRTLRTKIVQLFEKAHAEGRATMGHTEFLLAASVARISEKEVRAALTNEIIRKGMTGFWIKEAADPGALLIFKSAMSATVDAEEA